MSIPLKMKLCVLRHSASAAVVGVPGAFAAHADIPVLVGLWANMIYRLAKHSEKDMDFKTAGRIAAAVGTAV